MSALTFGDPASIARVRGDSENPMVNIHGAGPIAARCRTCCHITWNYADKRYWKCRLRGVSASATTDHRLKWPACSLYQEAA